MANPRNYQSTAGDPMLDDAPERASSPATDHRPGAGDGKRPVYRTRLGRVVGCVWENQGESGVFYSATVYRIYKTDGSDTWTSAASFRRNDLPLVAKIADALHSWIFAAQQGSDVSS